VPLPPGCDSTLFRARIAAEMLPAIRDFSPELIVISAGFDAHELDPLAGLRLTNEDFFWVTEKLMKIADETCQGRVVSILEGGYSMDGLAGGTRAHMRALLGMDS